MQSVFLFGLAPCRVCQADAVTHIAGGLLHHHFTLTSVTSDFSDRIGVVFSVALSVGLFITRRLRVTKCIVLWSSDFPHQY